VVAGLADRAVPFIGRGVMQGRQEVIGPGKVERRTHPGVLLVQTPYGTGTAPLWSRFAQTEPLRVADDSAALVEVARIAHITGTVFTSITPAPR